MIEDIETKGYGLPYLGIKPTAAGVVPVAPPPHIPSASEIPPMSQPIKVPASRSPSHISSPMPFSQPKTPLVSQPMKTTQAPMSNMQVAMTNPAQNTQNTPLPARQPAAPQITGPVYPPLSKATMPNIPMGGIQNGYDEEEENAALPKSLQPQPFKPEQPTPSFNRLTNILRR